MTLFRTDPELEALRRARDELFLVMDEASDRARATSRHACRLLERHQVTNDPADRAAIRADMEATLDEAHRLHVEWRKTYLAWSKADEAATARAELLLAVRS